MNKSNSSSSSSNSNTEADMRDKRESMLYKELKKVRAERSFRATKEHNRAETAAMRDASAKFNNMESAPWSRSGWHVNGNAGKEKLPKSMKRHSSKYSPPGYNAPPKQMNGARGGAEYFANELGYNSEDENSFMGSGGPLSRLYAGPSRQQPKHTKHDYKSPFGKRQHGVNNARSTPGHNNWVWNRTEARDAAIEAEHRKSRKAARKAARGMRTPAEVAAAREARRTKRLEASKKVIAEAEARAARIAAYKAAAARK